MNCEFINAPVNSMPIEDDSMDFGYSLGVLHHVPDTRAGIRACVSKLKQGAPFLVYLYYAFDNRPGWYRGLWRMSDGVRHGISRLPKQLKQTLAEAIAVTVYLPLARTARLAERLGHDVSNAPLAAYRDKSFYTMRTDAPDHFGTRLERRFSAGQIKQMMLDAGLKDISFSNEMPFWCEVGVKG